MFILAQRNMDVMMGPKLNELINLKLLWVAVVFIIETVVHRILSLKKKRKYS